MLLVAWMCWEERCDLSRSKSFLVLGSSEEFQLALIRVSQSALS
jgi:hypothetical protein